MRWTPTRSPLLAALLAAALVAPGCASDDAGGITVDFPHTVVLKAEQGLVAATGEVVDSPDFKNCDLVTYASSPINLSSGCPVSAIECQPLYICRATIAAPPESFTDLTGVCIDLPEDTIQSTIPNVRAGWGFVMTLNTRPGTARFLVKEVTGTGRQASVTLEYEILPE